VRIEDGLANNEPTVRPQHTAQLTQRGVLVRHLAEHLDQERGVEGACLERQRSRIGPGPEKVGQALLPGFAQRVLKPFGQHVDDVERAFR